MQLRSIGGASVGAVGLGGAAWSLDNRLRTDEAVGIVHAALDLGVTLLDTARAYTRVDHPSHNEWLIRRALSGHPRRDDALIVTKGGHYRSDDGGFAIDGRPAALRAHCYDSIRNLGVEQIGLYMLHHPDPNVPLEESVGTLSALQQEGAAQMIGVSNVTAQQLATVRSEACISAVQNHFSPYDTTDRAMITNLEAAGIAYLSFSPLGGSRRVESADGVLPAITRVAKRRAISTSRATLAWELAVATNVIPVIGASRVSTLHDSIRAESCVLTSRDFECIAHETGPWRPEGVL